MLAALTGGSQRWREAAGAAEGRWECSLAAHEPAGKQERSCGSTLCVSATRLLSRPPL